MMSVEVSAVTNFSTATAGADDTVLPTLLSRKQGTQYYTETLLIAIGLVGSAANGLVLYVLCVSKGIKKNTTHVLFINQMAADMYSCVMLIVVYSLKHSNIYLEGPGGYWLCCLFISEDVMWIGLNASIMNLASITVERYIMIVHPAWHKNIFRPWMTYAVVIFTWIASIVVNVATFFSTSVVVDGHCLPGAAFANRSSLVAFGFWNFVSFFLIDSVIFVYCYSHILYVLHLRQRVIPSRNVNNDAVSELQVMKSARIEMNIIKTMIIVTAVFILCWLPSNVYLLVFFVTSDVSVLSDGYYSTEFISFLSVCINPFIYAGKYELIRRHLMVCKRNFTIITESFRGGSKPIAIVDA